MAELGPLKFRLLRVETRSYLFEVTQPSLEEARAVLRDLTVDTDRSVCRILGAQQHSPLVLVQGVVDASRSQVLRLPEAEVDNCVSLQLQDEAQRLQRGAWALADAIEQDVRSTHLRNAAQQVQQLVARASQLAYECDRLNLTDMRTVDPSQYAICHAVAELREVLAQFCPAPPPVSAPAKPQPPESRPLQVQVGDQVFEFAQPAAEADLTDALAQDVRVSATPTLPEEEVK